MTKSLKNESLDQNELLSGESLSGESPNDESLSGTASTDTSLKGKLFIKSQIAEIPELPGIYLMLGYQNNILYIGKAKNLKNRISQYTLTLTEKNEKMISLTHRLEYNVTKSESAALLLEGQMIKKHKPKFNILLKDDKSFPYIKLRLDTEYPQLLKYRGRQLDEGKFFGPFASSKHVDVTLDELQKIFKLRSCTDSFFALRSRPCMQYQIKKCTAPCVGKISLDDYKTITKQIISFFEGKNQDLQEQLANKMRILSEKMEYEKAAELRDRIKALSYIQLRSKGSTKTLYDADIIALAEKNGEYCLQLFMYRQGQPCGNTPFFPVHTESASRKQVMESFLSQFYQNKVPPKTILINTDIDVEDRKLIAVMLKELHNKTVEIMRPKLGEKLEVMETATQNAELALERQLKKTAKNASSLRAIADLFGTENFGSKDIGKNTGKNIERIEIYDNSHIQGAHAIGAMVVAGPDGFEKKEYRLYNIQDGNIQSGSIQSSSIQSSSIQSGSIQSGNRENGNRGNSDTKNGNTELGGDDYAMLREVLSRRFMRMRKEPHRRPDLMIIDGGKGHLSTALKVREKFGEDVAIISMSKGEDRNSGREQFHVPGREPFTLPKHDMVMKYLQILRDEAHNFAIKSHRSKRSSAISHSRLDDISGIGKHRKKLLLDYFGSFKAVADATARELAQVKGISNKTAKQIYNSLHEA